MIHPDLIFGRMGNRMFQMAALYSFAKKLNNGDIFFTDIKWFDDCKEDIKKLYGQGILNEPRVDKVAIHVRLGDFVRPPRSSFHANLCETDYYEQAIKLFPNEKFLVFCANGDPENDAVDQEWCKDYFNKLGIDFEIANTGDGIEDMNLMARCKHQIIGNSSFSWWAAFLNPNPNKIVVSADDSCWCKDKTPRVIVPRDWIIIKPNDR